MAKERIISLPQTKGTFEVSGIVSGVSKDNFYKDTKTSTGKPMRMINFGVEFDENKTLYVGLMGFPQDKVYFSGKENKTDAKNTTINVTWKERMSFKKDGFQLIGVGCGLAKDENDKNIKSNLTQFDACSYMNDNLEDGMSVFIRGDIEYSTYKEVTQMKYVIKQIYSSSKPIDFKDEKFIPKCNIEQNLIITKLEKLGKDEERTFVSDSGKEVSMARLTCLIVSYDHIEEFNPYVADINGFCKTINTTLNKSGSFGITMLGTVHVANSTETVEDEDGWGETQKNQKVNQSTVREIYFNKGIKESLNIIDFKTDKIDEAITTISQNNKSSKDYSNSDQGGWGDVDGGTDLKTAGEDIPETSDWD